MSYPSKRWRALAGLCFVWIALLCVCAVVRPLQLDEILQLGGTRGRNVAPVFAWIRVNAGAVPIGYLLQWGLIRIAGSSSLVARLPSIVAAAVTVFAILRISKGRNSGVLALLAFVTPVLFRYSIEARPYLPALCLSALATMLLLRLIEAPDAAPRMWLLGLYTLMLAAAPLVQATAATVTVAHGVFVVSDPVLRRNRRRLRWALLAAIGLSLIGPAAWSLAMRDAWAHSIQSNGQTFAISFRTAFGFLKDLTFGGAICTSLLVAGAVYGYMRGGLPAAAKHLLAWTVFAAIGGALASDALAGYFSSPRQAIYSLFGLIVLAASGWGHLRSRYPAAGMLVLAIFGAVALAKDVSIVRSKEDWQAASRMLSVEVRQGLCLAPASEQASPLPLYLFFDPSLESHRCGGAESNVGLVHNLYTPRNERDAAAAALASRGFVSAGTNEAGGTTLERYVRQGVVR